MNRFQQRRAISWLAVLVVAGTLVISEFDTILASDHLDTPTVIADLAADIGDIFAWTSSDGKRLNLVMDIVAHQFSDRLQYVFHVDSGKSFGKTTATTLIVCRFRSLLVNGTMSGAIDGLDHDDKVLSITDFPFLAAP